MTDAQYTALHKTLQVVLQNQQALNDNMLAFQREVDTKLQALGNAQDIGHRTTQLVDSHCDIIREEVRLIKSLIAQQVLPRLGAEFPDGHIPLEFPGPTGLPKQ